MREVPDAVVIIVSEFESGEELIKRWRVLLVPSTSFELMQVFDRYRGMCYPAKHTS